VLITLAATTPPPPHEAFVRLWMVLAGLSVLAVVCLTVLAAMLSMRRHRLATPPPKRQVTSRLSAWEEAGTRADPWQGPDPADLDALGDDEP